MIGEMSRPPRLGMNLLIGASWLMPADARRAIKTLPVFLDYLATEQTFDNRSTQALLATTGLDVPAPATYLDKVLGYYLQNTKRS